MRGITELSTTSKSTRAVRASLAASVAACALGVACSQTPTAPTLPNVSATATDAVVGVANAQGTNQSWEHFAAHGWNCRTPVPGVTVCSPPGEPLPAVVIPPAQPPADRPPTVVLKRWVNGVFNANVLLIRPETYNGQPCASTGQAFTYVERLGYFECAHTVGN
jgi:hypothetical protein